MAKMYALEIDENGNENRREFTEEEYAIAARDEKEWQNQQAIIKAREIARASALAKLAALGLTEDEIAAL